MTSVGELVAAALTEARASYLDVAAEWGKASTRLGSRLPNSLLPFSIQHCGEIDVLLLAMEDETTKAMGAETDNLLPFHCQSMLSGLWVGSLYEVCRLAKCRKLVTNDGAFEGLEYDLRLVRVPLEKHEIAADKKLPNEVKMVRVPPNGDETDVAVYRKADAQKAHIMQCRPSSRGSLMWQAIDPRGNSVRWIERRQLSERFRLIFTG